MCIKYVAEKPLFQPLSLIDTRSQQPQVLIIGHLLVILVEKHIIIGLILATWL